MHLHDLQQIAWQIAEDKGHHDTLRTMPLREATLVRLALAHTEVSEATQEVKRHGIGAHSAYNLAHEVVDAIIRLVEMVQDINEREHYHIDLDTVLDTVLAANRQRPYLYGTPEQQERNPID